MVTTRTRYSSDPSERARQLHAEGKIGGASFGKLGGQAKARKRTPTHPGETASALVARAASDRAEDILKVLEDAAAEGQLPHHRLNAVKLWLGVESRETERVERQDRYAAEAEAIEAMGRDQLVAFLAAKLSNPRIAKVLQRQMAELPAEQPPPLRVPSTVDT